MQRTAERILRHAGSRPEGSLISAKELLHLAGRAAIDQALRRLHGDSKLMRVGRGLYVLPVQTRFGIRAPGAEKVIECFAVTHAETIVSNGAAAANRLGLTQQVPVKLVYLTSGPNRQLRLGKQTVEIKHAPGWMLLPGQPAVGEAVRALAWLGERQAAKALTALKRKLPKPVLKELIVLRPALPTWMSKSIGQALAA